MKWLIFLWNTLYINILSESFYLLLDSCKTTQTSMKLNEHLNEGPVKLISHSCQDHVETLDLQIPLKLKDKPQKLTQFIHNRHQSLVELNEHPEKPIDLLSEQRATTNSSPMSGITATKKQSKSQSNATN